MEKDMKKILGFLILAVVLQISLASALTLSDVSASPNPVEPGKEVRLVIELTNEASTIYDVNVALTLAGLPIAAKTTSEMYLEKIRSDDSEDADFDLIVDGDAESQAYKIPVKITYRDDNVTLTKQSEISINVNAEPSLELYSEGFLLVGEKNKVTIKVVNNGIGKAKFLQLTAGEGNYRLFGSSTFYIGDLNSNDFDTSIFEILANKDGALSIPVDLQYRDSRNVEFSETKSVSIMVYSRDEAKRLGLISTSNAGIIFLVIVILIILFIVYRVIRGVLKKKKKQREI